MGNQISFSLITVSSNSSKTIERTINSVLSQTYQDFEYIIIDGSSTDRTLDIIKKYESKFNNNYHWISEPDSGIYNAMNKGIQMAKGEIIGIINSDDWLEPNALEIISKSIMTSGSNNTIYCGWMNFCYQNGRKQLLKTNNDRFNRYSKKYLMGINHPATFVPLTIYKKYGYFDENLRISADIEFIIRAVKNNVKFCFIDGPLTNMSGGGVSSHFSKQKYIDRKYLLKKYTKNRIEYYYYILSYIVITILKFFVPERLLFPFRKLNRK